MKHVNDPPELPPTSIGRDLFKSVYFCDSDGGRHAAGQRQEDGRTWSLAIFDHTGKLLRTLATDVRPVEGPVASWRKYGHE